MSSPDSVSLLKNGVNGLENLADELADVWDDDYDGYEEGLSQMSAEDMLVEPPVSSFKVDVRRIRDSGIDVSCSTDTTPSKSRSSKETMSRNPSPRYVPQSPTLIDQALRERSRNSGSFTRDETEYVWRSIDMHLNDLARLTPQDISEQSLIASKPSANTFERFRELGDQATIEKRSSRLIGVYDTASSHLLNHINSFQPFTYAVLASLPQTMEESDYDEFLSLMVSTISSLPKPSTTLLPSLTQLNRYSKDTVDALKTLSDSLHMGRQTTEAAARRLKVVTALASELSHDALEVEESVQWIEEGCWQDRLEKRESAALCSEVLTGFEAVCDNWRARLMDGLEVTVL